MWTYPDGARVLWRVAPRCRAPHFTTRVFGHSVITPFLGGPPASMNHVKIFKGWPPRDAPSKLVQLRYKTFSPAKRGMVEMTNPTRLSNKISTT